VDLERVLAGPHSAAAGRHPLPAPEVFAAELGALGLAGAPIVAFDEGPGAVAARLVWLLRAIGEPAAVLDGGLGAWTGPTAAGGAVLPPTTRPVRPWPASSLIDAAEVAELAGTSTGVVLDARARERYAGELEPVDPRAGHVPGARNAPFAANLGPEGCLRPLDELRAGYAALGVRAGAEVAVYCGSGVTACHDLLVLEALGHPGRLFAASWSGWSADPTRPAAVGPTPWGDLQPDGSDTSSC
jgi:thiosulfate/3-mercaptopyruvate sulfurtransferase